MANVLVVDDSVSLRRLVAQTLATAGHHVAEASNGATALCLIKAQGYDLIISDINMPIMDGLTFIRCVRKLSVGTSMPILMLTTDADPVKKKMAKEVGATGWLVKPFVPDQLVSAVRQILE